MDYDCHKAPFYLKDRHLSIGTKEYLQMLNASDTPVESLPVAKAREVLANAQAAVEVDLSGIEESEKTIIQDGFEVKLNLIRPAGKQEILPVFIFLHGGGWVLGDYPTHRRMVRDLVIESGMACVFPNYSLSPEAKFPQAVNEIYATLKWVSENGPEILVDGKRIGLVGNSAGGNMSVVTALMSKDNNGPEIKVLVLMWPATDMNDAYESFTKFGEDRFLTSSLAKWVMDQYMTDPVARKDIHTSPVLSSIEQLKGLPPTLIEVAENDILRDEGELLGRKLDEAGVDVTTIRFGGVIHDWGMLNGFAQLSPTRSLISFSAATLQKYLEENL